MIWFFERPGERLQCEIRQAASGPGFELVWTSSDGRIHVELSDDASELMRRRARSSIGSSSTAGFAPAASLRFVRSAPQRTRKTDARHFH